MCCSHQKICRIHYVKITDQKRVEVFGLGISMGQYEHKSTCYFIKTRYVASTSCLIAVTIASLLRGGYGFSQGSLCDIIGNMVSSCIGDLQRKTNLIFHI